MKLIEGKLKRLGEATVNLKNEIVKYSLIQIGDQTLTNVSVDRKLNNFLADGIETDQPTKLWLLNGGKAVMGVQVGDDTRYFGTVNPFVYFALLFNVGLALVMGAALHPLAGVAWGFLVYMVLVRKLLDCRQIAAVGGMKV